MRMIGNRDANRAPIASSVLLETESVGGGVVARARLKLAIAFERSK